MESSFEKLKKFIYLLDFLAFNSPNYDAKFFLSASLLEQLFKIF